MEALKLKIFDVLTRKMPVSEFENWLYNSVDFMNKIGVDLFCFDIISINYKDEKWSKELLKLTEAYYGSEFIQILSIETTCLNIFNTKSANEIYELVIQHTEYFDYDTDYKILWGFYEMECSYNSFQYSLLDKIGFSKEAKFYAQQVLENLKCCTSIMDKKEVLILDLKPYKIYRKEEKQTVKQKFLAFFKKI